MSWALIDLFQPHLILSSVVFQIAFVHLVYNYIEYIYISKLCSFKFTYLFLFQGSQVSVVGIMTHYILKGLGLEPCWG